MQGDAAARRVFDGGRPCIHYQIEEALSSIGVTNRRQALKKQRSLEGCVAADRNLLIGLLWPIK